MVLVDMQGEEEEVIAEDVGLSCGIRKVVRIQIPLVVKKCVLWQ